MLDSATAFIATEDIPPPSGKMADIFGRSVSQVVLIIKSRLGRVDLKVCLCRPVPVALRCVGVRQNENTVLGSSSGSSCSPGYLG